jgi:hypothetical protein
MDARLDVRTIEFWSKKYAILGQRISSFEGPSKIM